MFVICVGSLTLGKNTLILLSVNLICFIDKICFRAINVFFIEA